MPDKIWDANEISTYFWNLFTMGQSVNKESLAKTCANDGFGLPMLSIMLRGAQRKGHLKETTDGVFLWISKP